MPDPRTAPLPIRGAIAALRLFAERMHKLAVKRGKRRQAAEWAEFVECCRTGDLERVEAGIARIKVVKAAKKGRA